MSPASGGQRQRGFTRRATVRAALGGAALVAAGGALAACGPSTTSASTTTANPTTQIVFRPWYNFANGTSKTGVQLLHNGLDPWLAKNPSVNVTISTMGYQGTTVAALLAGTGPDVFADWILPLYTAANLVLPIDSYVRQENIDLSVFPPKEMQYFKEDGPLYALPSYLHLESPIVNKGALDDLGINYPESGWTSTDWGNLWAKVSNKSSDPKQTRVGGDFNWGGYDYYGSNPNAHYLAGFGGEYVDPSDRTKCYLSNPGTAAGFAWTYGLLQNGYCDTGTASFASGQKITSRTDTAGGLITAAQSYKSMNWQVYDEPLYPKGQVNYAASDFYAIFSGTKYPDICWDLMKFLCVTPDWQRWMMQLALAGPNQIGLYDEWVAAVKAAATPLAGIDLDVFSRQMKANGPYFGLTFKYNDTGANTTMTTLTNNALNLKVDLPTALQQATTQVNALEQAGAGEASAQSQVATQFPVKGTPIAGVSLGL